MSTGEHYTSRLTASGSSGKALQRRYWYRVKRRRLDGWGSHRACLRRKCISPLLQSQIQSRIPRVFGGLSELLLSELCKNRKSDESTLRGVYPLASRTALEDSPLISFVAQRDRRDFRPAPDQADQFIDIDILFTVSCICSGWRRL